MECGARHRGRADVGSVWLSKRRYLWDPACKADPDSSRPTEGMLWGSLGFRALSWRSPLQCLTLGSVWEAASCKFEAGVGRGEDTVLAIQGALVFCCYCRVFAFKLLLCARYCDKFLLLLQQPPREKCYYSHFTDGGTEAQRIEVP